MTRKLEGEPGTTDCSSLRIRDTTGLGMVQRNVLGLCTIHHGRFSIDDLASELGRTPSEIAKVVNSLGDRGLLNGLIPTKPLKSDGEKT